MQNGSNEVVPKTVLEIEVDHFHEKINVDLKEVFFTEIEPFYTDSKPNHHKGILHRYSLEELLVRLNAYIGNGVKSDAPAILKGIYEGGTSGIHCVSSTPFLFFDVDVKEKENPHLLEPFKNAKAFELLKEFALLVWRSNSGNGIAGILYVPQLIQLTRNDSAKHKKVGDAITSYLSTQLLKRGVKIKFDAAQNKFRQIRFLAEQNEHQILNQKPVTISYIINEIERELQPGIKAFKYTNFSQVSGSIREQFNQTKSIVQSMLDCGFVQVNGTNRYKHRMTQSASSGSIDQAQNLFFNHSQSFSNIPVFDPFSLFCFVVFSNDFSAFYGHLKELGYQDQLPTKKDVEEAENILNQETEKDREKEIYRACNGLQLLPFRDKKQFIEENCKNPTELPLFYAYLQFNKIGIPYDKHLIIEKYVSEQLELILSEVDENEKIIVRAETGTGKTTAFLKDFTRLRPGKRCLIIVPLTIIAEQSKKDYPNIVCLTGKSSIQEHRLALSKPLIIATYEQGAKHLLDGNKFDYVVVDEMHNLLTANSYKNDTIRDVTNKLNGIRVIGLTGTPNSLFKSIGYKLLNVAKKDQMVPEIIQRIDNRDPYKIIIQHLKKIEGKALFRVNSKDTLKAVSERLIKELGYSKDEILLLYSEQHIKNGVDFQMLTRTNRFKEGVKVILTTAIIDEGLNIEQVGFTDVVFIENNYNPRPEPLKQFFARLRNEDPTRKYYHYYKKKKDQTEKYYNPEVDFEDKLDNLKIEISGITEFCQGRSTWKDLANDDQFYYNDFRINKYYLGYQITDKYFSIVTHEEFNAYLELNYNLKIELDTSYNVCEIDTEALSAKRLKTKENLYQYWTTSNDEVLQAVIFLTSNRKIKDLFEDNRQPLEDEILNEVQSNLSKYEKLFRNQREFLDLGIEDPNLFLIENESIKSRQKINRDLQHLHTKKVIDNPQTTRDKRNRGKILAFLNDMAEKKVFTMNELFKIWNKQKVTNYKSYKSYYLLDLLSWYFGGLSRSHKGNVYSIDNGA